MSKAEILAYNRGRADAIADTEVTNRQAMAMAAEALLLDLLSVHNGTHVCTKSIDGATCPSEYVYNLIGDAVYERCRTSTGTSTTLRRAADRLNRFMSPARLS